ncbi:hypothetical protein ATG71_4218 [Bacillus sp. es.034]|nr:hypothetical protein ATG71_4218 [Bacillus sp. es.034]
MIMSVVLRGPSLKNEKAPIEMGAFSVKNNEIIVVDRIFQKLSLC